MKQLKKYSKLFIGGASVLPFLFLFIFIPLLFSSFFMMNEADGGSCGSYKDIKLCDTGNRVKDIAWANQKWNKTSDQYEIFNCDAGGCSYAPKEGQTKYGELKKDDLGFYYYEQNSIKFYCNAVASYYTKNIGDRFRITTDEGNVFHIIIADQKADNHTHAGNNDPSTHCLSATGGMLEFYVDKHIFKGGSLDRNIDESHNFKGAVAKVEKYSNEGCLAGSIDDMPNFENVEIWKEKNPFSCMGQCTWFAWGRFYEIYGYDPMFRGDGYMCARQLVQAHPDKFELATYPKAGAVGSSDRRHNHVWIVTAVNGSNITIQEGNLAGHNGNILACDPWEFAKTDWHTRTYTWDQLRRAYGDMVFANPK